MKKYSDFKAERSSSGRETLPAGGYVCKILSAKVESNDWGDTLVIAHDVCEGDYAGIFQRDFSNNDREDKRWRGTYRTAPIAAAVTQSVLLRIYKILQNAFSVQQNMRV